MIEILKGILSLPTALNGLVSGRTSLKADVQARNDLRTHMRVGLQRVDKVLASATSKQKAAAEDEYRRFLLPPDDPNRCTSFKTSGKVPVNNAAKLFLVTKDVEAILSIGTVFLSRKLRCKLNDLRKLLQTCEIDYEHYEKEFRFARCYRLKQKMNSILKEAKVNSSTQKIAGKI